MRFIDFLNSKQALKAARNDSFEFNGVVPGHSFNAKSKPTALLF